MSEVKETWRPFPLNPEMLVSDLGRLLGPKRVPFIGAKNSRGYMTARTRVNGKNKMFLVHRMVALAFYGASDLEVNHINGNKEDNRLMNLEYVTRSENMRHAFALGIYIGSKGSTNPTAKITEAVAKKVKEMLAAGTMGSVISKELGISYYTVSNIKRGRHWKHV